MKHPLPRRRHADRGWVEAVEDPDAAERDEAGQHDARQGLHQRAEQGRERGQRTLARLEQLLAGPIERSHHARRDHHQQDLLPQRPILPRRLEHPADLPDRPGPDQLHELEDRRDALLQELQYLIEDLLHDQASLVS